MRSAAQPDTASLEGNVRQEVFERYLGRDTDSMRSAAQSYTDSLEGNVRYEGLERYLDRDTDSMRSAAQPDNVSEEAIELQVMGHAHHPPNLDTDKEDTLSSNDSHDV